MMESAMGQVGSISDILRRMGQGPKTEPIDHIGEAEELARLLAEIDGVEIDSEEPIRAGETKTTRSYWKKACAAYAFLRGVDLEEIVREEMRHLPRPLVVR